MYTQFVKPGLLQFMDDFKIDWVEYADKFSNKTGPDDFNFQTLLSYFSQHSTSLFCLDLIQRLIRSTW
eukprot:m.105002 g.105002  ORF g.105002 m.105002 type:complete len:68 (+) comp12627_c1_seq1:2-205(+)